MKIRLMMFVPAIERGKNNRPSYSRTNYYLIEVNAPLPWARYVDKKTLNGSNVTLTIVGLKALLTMAKDKRDKRVTFYSPDVLQLNFDMDNNIGFDGEKMLPRYFPEFVKSTPDEDARGIDFWVFNEPVQLKTFAHGITEFTANVLDGENKKRGLSCVNVTLEKLLNWEF